MFVILLAVSLRSVWSLQNISVLFTFVVLFVWIPLHSSSICSCVSVGSPHLRQVTLLCLPLKLFFTSSILVRALNMVDASILVSLFIYVFLLPGFHVVLFNRYCVLVFPSAFVFIMSANLFLMFMVVMVSVCCLPSIEVFILFVISFHPPFVWLFIIFATSLSGFFWILFPMFSLFFVVIVFMSSSPVSIYSVSVGVDCGTISTRRMIFSCIRFSDFCSFLFIFQLSPPYVMMGWMQVSTNFHAVSSSILL